VPAVYERAGIGVLLALAYVRIVEDPGRFSRSRSVDAHLGLTPRQYQSGEVDRSSRISKCGDTPALTLMYEAAVVIHIDPVRPNFSLNSTVYEMQMVDETVPFEKQKPHERRLNRLKQDLGAPRRSN
jgi:transposase IS116/IS110/IS902 family protein